MATFAEIEGARGLLVKMGLGEPKSRAFVAGGLAMPAKSTPMGVHLR
jgi:hypothetical protein